MFALCNPARPPPPLQGRDLWSSSHFTTAVIGLVLLSLQGMLSFFFEVGEGQGGGGQAGRGGGRWWWSGWVLMCRVAPSWAGVQQPADPQATCCHCLAACPPACLPACLIVCVPSHPAAPSNPPAGRPERPRRARLLGHRYPGALCHPCRPGPAARPLHLSWRRSSTKQLGNPKNATLHTRIPLPRMPRMRAAAAAARPLAGAAEPTSTRTRIQHLPISFPYLWFYPGLGRLFSLI